MGSARLLTRRPYFGHNPDLYSCRSPFGQLHSHRINCQINIACRSKIALSSSFAKLAMKTNSKLDRKMSVLKITLGFLQIRFWCSKHLLGSSQSQLSLINLTDLHLCLPPLLHLDTPESCTSIQIIVHLHLHLSVVFLHVRLHLHLYVLCLQLHLHLPWCTCMEVHHHHQQRPFVISDLASDLSTH